jgi:Beta-ketoacyl synthase, N-terminal domain
MTGLIAEPQPERQTASVELGPATVDLGPAASVDTGPAVLARAEWPVGPADTLPAIAGFVVSSFSPLVAEVAERCLTARYGTAPAATERTGVVLASVAGDVATTDAVAAALAAGRRVPPLLFFQSNPNAVVGYVTERWGLFGPVVCLSPAGDPYTDALDAAALLFDDGAADEVLVITADLAHGPGERDHAVAVLVGPATSRRW